MCFEEAKRQILSLSALILLYKNVCGWLWNPTTWAPFYKKQNFFPENVIMTRLEFIKRVLHCIEELTEQQTPFFTQGLVGFSVHLSDNVNSLLINQTLVKSQGSFLGHKESIDLCTLLIKTCHSLILWVQFPFTVLLIVYSAKFWKEA